MIRAQVALIRNQTRKLIVSFPDIAAMALGWKPIHFGLAGMMLVFGSFNTLSVKWADTMTSQSLDGTQKKFNHPFVQAIGKIFYWIITTAVSVIADILQECSWERCSVWWPSGLLAGKPAANRESPTRTSMMPPPPRSSIPWYVAECHRLPSQLVYFSLFRYFWPLPCVI